MYTNRAIPSLIESPHVTCCYRGFIVLINMLQFTKDLTMPLMPAIVKLYFKFPKSTVLMYGMFYFYCFVPLLNARYRVAVFLANNVKGGDIPTFLERSKV
jgi:hypothetical protein